MLVMNKQKYREAHRKTQHYKNEKSEADFASLGNF